MSSPTKIVKLTADSILDEPWTNPRGTENDMKRKHRASLPAGYPEDLSRGSNPANGSLGFGGMPISNRAPAWKNLKGGR